ncbi:MAG: AtpZ/AtpI family protein [Gemmatimonadaceae bacterium]
MSAQKPAEPGGIGDENDAPSTSGYAAAGLQFAVALVLFALGGDWLDGKFRTAPLFLLLGVFGGGAAAFYSMYRKLMGHHGRKPEKE